MTAMFSKPKAPKPATPATPDKKPVPMVDENAIEEAKNKKIAATQQKRSGRQSTILSQNDTLGGS